MSTPQRMSTDRLAELEGRMTKGYDSYELLLELIAERARLDRVDALEVHEFHCYYPELANRQFVELKDIQAITHPQEPKDE